MGRGRYPARLEVAPPPPELAARYLLRWRSHELFHEPGRFPPLSSASLFGDDRPLEIDLGCATGDFLCALAARRPDANYLGVELVAKPLFRAVEQAAALGLANLRFLQADVRLILPRIPAGALRAAYLHFPAPMLERGKRKQRLLSADLLAHMARCLAPGGWLQLLTDEPALVAELAALLPGAPELRPLGPAAWPFELDAGLKSHYHRRWEARGRPIARVVLGRSAPQ